MLTIHLKNRSSPCNPSQSQPGNSRRRSPRPKDLDKARPHGLTRINHPPSHEAQEQETIPKPTQDQELELKPEHQPHPNPERKATPAQELYQELELEQGLEL
ncbi:hypothetical protein SKAU_G00362350 [Synaphobranchus kaupii]|uniref:Uncharacterized protein n=1 Tax=Synaphobranchus kaupii TaxID=118154 RepID=A0A9Q1IH89_SYNKA|nr:hypothetical protein SKAU_G00362350 [Synaphobranchus kaupii]